MFTADSVFAGLQITARVLKSMVLTKAYLRYASVGCFGVVCSTRGHALFVKRKGQKSGSAVVPFVAVPALENVIVWDIRTGDQVCHSLIVHKLYKTGL